MRSRLAIPLVLLLSIASSSIVSADPGDGAAFDRGPSDASVLALITDNDLFSLVDLSTAFAAPLTAGGANATQHYGPYASDSPDSGTCGDWAQDTFDRHFTVRPNGDGTFTIVEQFKSGSFVSDPGGASPGACDPTDGTPPGTIDAGIVGEMHGYFVITLTGTQTSHDPGCGTDPCTTFGFVTSHFAGTYTIGTFFFHYSAGDQGLVVHEWKNASEDRGGNHGDIASSQP
jgi:hypothetical protein